MFEKTYLLEKSDNSKKEGFPELAMLIKISNRSISVIKATLPRIEEEGA